MVEIEKFELDIKNEDERIIAGYATVEVKDLQGDIVPISEMIKAMIDYMDRGGLIMYGHSNKPVGKVLYWDVKKHPETGEYGVYIIAKINRGYKFEDEVWKKIKEGVIKGFSVGGHGQREVGIMKRDDGTEEPVRIVKNLELFEISLVEEPANPYATIVEYSLAKSNENNVLREIVKSLDIDYDKFVNEYERVLNSEMFKTIKEKYVDIVAYDLFDKKYEELSEEEKYLVQKVFEAFAKIIAGVTIAEGVDEENESSESNSNEPKGVSSEQIVEDAVMDKGDEKKEEEGEKEGDVDKMQHPTEIKTAEQIIEEAKESFEGGKKVEQEVNTAVKEGRKPNVKRHRVIYDVLVEDIEREIDKALEKVREIKKRKRDECKSRYMDPNQPNRFKPMTCPDDPSKKSRFCGCVRYFMNCRGMSLEQAKRMCGYIKQYVKR